jgi:uncharacterized protein YndB with AHSA1/START domain
MRRLLAFAVVALCLGYTARSAYGEDILSNKLIRKSKTVNCSIDTVWWKWTTHDGLRTFFGEDNKMELKIGGPFEIYFSMEAPAGSRGSEGCNVISYVPKEMLSFSWSAPPKFPDIRNGEYHTWVVVTFKALKGHRTEVTISHLGWLKGEDWDQVYKYFDKAWVMVLDWLDRSCKKKDSHR